MPTVSAVERQRALWGLLLANFFWGLSFPLIKSILTLQEKLIPGLDGWLSTLLTVAPRFLMAVPLLLLMDPLGSWRASRTEWRQGITLGLFATAGMLFQNDGLRFTSASVSAFLTQFSAILIPAWVALRARRDPGPRIWLCCVLVLAGVAILGRFDWRELRFGRGEWETLLSSLFFMGQILTLDRPEFAANRAAKVTLAMFVTEVVLFGGATLALAPDAATLLAPLSSPAWLGLTALLTVFCTIGSFSLMNACQPKITATEAGLIYCVEPVFASLLALFLPAIVSSFAGIDYPNETATWALLIGGGLITLANIILQLKPPAKA